MKIEEVIKQLESILAHVCSMAASPDTDDIWKEDIEALGFSIAALRSMQETTKPGWISVKERLPNEEDDVLILVREIEHYGRHHEKRKVYYWQFVGWRVDEKWATTYCHGFRYIDDENEKEPRCEHEVTHWMPLPKPPEED